MPDGVEASLDVVCQDKYGPQQHNKTDTDEDTALGMFQIRVYLRNNQFALLACHSLPELDFHQGVEAEPACDGKQDGKDRNDGQQGTVCQCGCPYLDTVVQKLIDGKINDFNA